MNISIPKGFKVGHFDDEFTGVTVILNEGGAVGGCDCRGGAPGTRETDLLKPEKMMEEVNAVVLSGGSAYGLAAGCGVMEYLKDHNIGYKTQGKVVPIVSQAVIYDLNQKDYHYPTAEYGYKACENADKELKFGCVGAGKGATCGKIRGLKYASKTGIGGATVKVGGITITAIVCVNALGDVFENGQIIAGAKSNKGEFINTENCLANGEVSKLLFGTNTTIGCIITNAKITKVQANKLASISHNGLARTIHPVHTDYDGDTMFCLASGHRPVINFAMLQSAAVQATEQAVINAAKESVDYTIVYDDSDDGWECE
ncbi:MAG: P1 family peptidase [Clostridia bacterium]|nr:P1 family peptidase [Clostridia bacterium]